MQFMIALQCQPGAFHVMVIETTQFEKFCRIRMLGHAIAVVTQNLWPLVCASTQLDLILHICTDQSMARIPAQAEIAHRLAPREPTRAVAVVADLSCPWWSSRVRASKMVETYFHARLIA